MENDDKILYDHIIFLNQSCLNKTSININSWFYNRNYPKCITRLIKQRCKCESTCLEDFFQDINFDRECKFWDLEGQFEDEKYINCEEDDIIRNLYFNNKSVEEVRRIIDYKYKTAVKLYNMNCKRSSLLENGLICAHDLVRSFCKGELECENEFHTNFPISYDCPEVFFENYQYFSSPKIHHVLIKETDDYLDEYFDEDDIVYDSVVDNRGSEFEPHDIYNYVMQPRVYEVEKERISENDKQENISDKEKVENGKQENISDKEKVENDKVENISDKEKFSEVKKDFLVNNNKFDKEKLSEVDSKENVILLDENESEGKNETENSIFKKNAETEKITGEKEIKLKEDSEVNRPEDDFIYEYEDSYYDQGNDFGEQFNDLENRLVFIDNRKEKTKPEVSNFLFLSNSAKQEVIIKSYPENKITNDYNFTKEKNFSIVSTVCDNQVLIAFSCAFFLLLFIISNWLITISRSRSPKITCLKIINLVGLILLAGASIFFIVCSQAVN